MQTLFSLIDGGSDRIGGILATFFVLLIFLILVVTIGLFVFWLAMLVDASRREVWPSQDMKVIVISVLAVSLFMQLWWVTALVYYFAIKRPLDAGKAVSFFTANPPAPPVQEAETAKPKRTVSKKKTPKKSTK